MNHNLTAGSEFLRSLTAKQPEAKPIYGKPMMDFFRGYCHGRARQIMADIGEDTDTFTEEQLWAVAIVCGAPYELQFRDGQIHAVITAPCAVRHTAEGWQLSVRGSEPITHR